MIDKLTNQHRCNSKLVIPQPVKLLNSNQTDEKKNLPNSIATILTSQNNKDNLNLSINIKSIDQKHNNNANCMRIKSLTPTKTCLTYKNSFLNNEENKFDILKNMNSYCLGQDVPNLSNQRPSTVPQYEPVFQIKKNHEQFLRLV